VLRLLVMGAARTVPERGRLQKSRPHGPFGGNRAPETKKFPILRRHITGSPAPRASRLAAGQYVNTRIRRPTERRHRKPLKRLNRPIRCHRTLQVDALGRPVGRLKRRVGRAARSVLAPLANVVQWKRKWPSCANTPQACRQGRTV